METTLINSLYQALGYAIDLINDEPQTFGDGVTLAFGKHTITVETGSEPTQVYLSLQDSGTGGCTTGGVSTAGYTTTATGFVAYVDVVADSSVLSWLVK